MIPTCYINQTKLVYYFRRPEAERKAALWADFWLINIASQSVAWIAHCIVLLTVQLHGTTDNTVMFVGYIHTVCVFVHVFVHVFVCVFVHVFVCVFVHVFVHVFVQHQGYLVSEYYKQKLILMHFN